MLIVYTKSVLPLVHCRAVYWQESGDTIRITIHGLRYDILRYCKQGDIGIFLILGIGYIFRKAVIKSHYMQTTLAINK